MTSASPAWPGLGSCWAGRPSAESATGGLAVLGCHSSRFLEGVSQCGLPGLAQLGEDLRLAKNTEGTSSSPRPPRSTEPAKCWVCTCSLWDPPASGLWIKVGQQPLNPCLHQNAGPVEMSLSSAESIRGQHGASATSQYARMTFVSSARPPAGSRRSMVTEGEVGSGRVVTVCAELYRATDSNCLRRTGCGVAELFL